MDRKFRLLDDQSSEAIAQTILSLGRAMGMSVVAEDVETQEQYRMLRQLGCRCFQGYLFGRPQPVEAFEDCWLTPSGLRVQLPDTT